MAFEDLGVHQNAGNRREYSINWSSWDGDGCPTPIPGTTGSQVPVFGSGQYLVATIKLAGNDDGGDAVTVYLRLRPAGPEVVGIDR